MPTIRPNSTCQRSWCSKGISSNLATFCFYIYIYTLFHKIQPEFMVCSKDALVKHLLGWGRLGSRWFVQVWNQKSAVLTWSTETGNLFTVLEQPLSKTNQRKPLLSSPPTPQSAPHSALRNEPSDVSVTGSKNSKVLWIWRVYLCDSKLGQGSPIEKLRTIAFCILIILCLRGIHE